MDLAILLIGLHHLHATGWMTNIGLVPGLRLAGIVEADQDLLRGVQAPPDVARFPDWREALAACEADIALILLPHAQMPAAAVAAALAGRHLIVEKPCAPSADALLPVGEAVAAHGVAFTSPYLWRYDPAVVRARQIVREGILGRPLYATGRIHAGGPHRYLALSAWMLEPQHGGGPLRNLGVHWVDALTDLIAAEPVTVLCQLGRQAQPAAVEDHARLLIEYDNGAQALVETSYCLPPTYPPAGYDYAFRLQGSAGLVEWSQRDDLLLVCTADGRRTEERVHRAPDPGGYGGQNGLDFLAALAEAIRGKRAPDVTFAQALRALQVVDAGYRSAAQGGAIAAQCDGRHE